MNYSDIANLTLKELCDLFKSGDLPSKFKNLSLLELMDKASKENTDYGREDGTSVVEANRDEHGQEVGDLEPAVDLEPTVELEPIVDLEPVVDLEPELEPEFAMEQEEAEATKKTFWWRESLPNSNYTNIPLLIWRGDENNSSTLALAFGLYEDEFKELQKDHVIEVKVKDSEIV